MRRKSLDQILSLTGLVVTVVLVVVGLLMMWGGNFAKDSVKEQLEVQNITFSEDAESLPPELADWAGVTNGLSYSEVSGQWFADGKPGPSADQNNPNSYDVRMTAFMGESLRGLLLNAYAFWTIGSIAVTAAWGFLGLALVMLVLTILGFNHVRKTDEKEAIFEPAA
jgi:hypothetical protein